MGKGEKLPSADDKLPSEKSLLMKHQLKPIRPKKISDQVFDQLREVIARGSIKPGEQLMPERELAEALGASRTTIRNAIKAHDPKVAFDKMKCHIEYVLDFFKKMRA